MPNTPFAKSNSPHDDIDLSLFSHIQNDPFLAGSFQLEGNVFIRTIAYFERYYATLPNRTPEIEAFHRKINRLVTIEARLVEIKSLHSSKQITQDMLLKLCEAITADLLSSSFQKEGNYLSLPGGWAGAGGGHAMVYQFKCVANGLEFYIHNAGSGIEYHERQSATDRELYYPVQAYLIPNPIRQHKLTAFLRDLLIPMLPNLATPQGGPYNAERIYQEVIASISFLDGVLLSVKGQAEHALTAGQLSGTCAQRVLHKMHNANFNSLADYQRDIYQFKTYALHDFIQVLQRKNQLGDPRIQFQLDHAINTLLRTLNSPHLFPSATIDRYRAELRQYRQLLQQQRNTILINKAHPAILPTAMRTLFDISLIPNPLTPLATLPLMSRCLEAKPLQPIVGGVTLLAEMRELLSHSLALNAQNQSSLVIDGLELLFASLPLPSHKSKFNSPLPFYQSISKENQHEFYQLIASLQDAYLNACKAIGSNAALPRMMVNGLSVISILDYVTHQLPLKNAGSPTYHQVISYVLHNFLYGNKHNPYFATNQPLLDKRLKFIENIYTSDDYCYPDLLDYYKGLIDSEPHLKTKLLACYRPPSDPIFAQALSHSQCQALYWFTEKLSEFSLDATYQPLTHKFNLQQQLESCSFSAIQLFLTTNKTSRISISSSGFKDYVTLRSLANAMKDGMHNRSLLKHKYGLSADLPCQHALRINYDNKPLSDPSRSDNHTQLFPSAMATRQYDRLTSQQSRELAERHIDRHEIAHREFFHLRGSPQHQLKLTLDFFQQHLTKLVDKSCQIYMEANLFEPGLLATELDKNPDYLNRIDQFIDLGLKHYADRGLTTDTSLFFIRLAFLVNQYAAAHQPELAYARLPQLLIRLASLLHIDKDNRAEIKQCLYQYQFLTAIAYLKLKPTVATPREQAEALAYLIPALFYINANANHNAFVDTSVRFDLECAKQEVQYLLAVSNPELIAELVHRSLNNLGLGVCENVRVDADMRGGSFYIVHIRQADSLEVYHVDVTRGLVFNSESMAYTAIPLHILHHPVMPFLSIDSNSLQPCFTSNDGLVFDLGTSELRFIRQRSDSPYRVQKKWTVDGQSQWFELHDLSIEQKMSFELDTATIEMPIYAVLRERDTQLWVSCNKPTNLLITEHHQPTYYYQQVLSGKWEAHQLGDDALKNGFTRCMDMNCLPTFLHRFFSTFEDPAYVSVCKRGDEFKITFCRYNLTILASINQGVWTYKLATNPNCLFVDDVEQLLPGAIGLIFEDQATHQRSCYLPLQPFIRQDGPSDRSEFHNLQQDNSGTVPREVVDKITRLSRQDLLLLPWQYTSTERVLSYPVGKNGQPYAKTACDALYLCYVHLGSQHPKKAWMVLEDCAKRLGGLKGTVDELILLTMIINALPRILKDKDSEATISTPAYVACQLKALALFTAAFTPDLIILFPAKTFNLKTPDGLYQQSCWEEVKGFHAQLNTTIYQLYSRFQSMQRHMEHGYMLKDNERKSLLDYYHFHLPTPRAGQSKALGSLGYEWQSLGLKNIKKEYEGILAQQQVKGPLPKAYQHRLGDIEDFLNQATTVRAHHTELELLPIDLSIPPELHFNPQSVPSFNYEWNNLNIPINASDTLRALELLTPNVTAQQLLLYFPCYYKVARSASMSPEKEALLTFCRHYLIAHRHTPLKTQDNQAPYLCNILYRIAQANVQFAHQVTYPHQLSHVLEVATKLPSPTISIYQITDKTTAALAEVREIWASLTNDSSPLMKPLEATRCTLLDDVSIERLLSACHLEPASQALCQQYIAAANRLSEKPRPAETSTPPTLATELEAGVEQCHALQATRTIAGELLGTPATRHALQQGAQSFWDRLDHERQSLADKMLRLANQGPAESTKKQHRDLELEGCVRAPLDEQRLLGLYFKANVADYALETELAAEEIQELHTYLSHFVAISVRQQSLQRFLNQINVADAVGDLSSLANLAHELLTDDRVDYQTESVLALLQYHENLLLRPQQIDAIKRLLASPDADRYAFKEEIIKIIMGGGKSKVILPALAQSKASGTNLVVIEVPPALFETNCVDLSNTSGRLFNQKVYPFQFNRDSNCSPESLEFLYNKLIQVIVSKDYVVTTGDAVQSLELKYLELLLQRPTIAEDEKTWFKQIAWLDQLITLFRTRADVLIDEVHQGLLLKKKLNYTLGDKRAVPAIIITECIELYRFFECVPMDTLGDAFAGLSLASILANPQWMTQDEQWQAAMAQLTDALLHNPASPLSYMLSHMDPKLTPMDSHSLGVYLSNQGDEIPACVLRAHDKTRTIFALYKEQVSQLLSQTLKRKLNENYGASKVRLEEQIAIPYVANNVPSERSRFGNYLEAINYTIQMLMIDGFSPSLLKDYLGQLQAQARLELLKDPSLKIIDNTITASAFHTQLLAEQPAQPANLEMKGDDPLPMAPGFCLSLSQINLDDETQFGLLFDQLRKNKAMIREVLKTTVLPQLKIEPQVLHHDAYNHVDIYRSCQGMTGTPSNSSTYHQRLNYDKKTAAATDGFILNRLIEKQTAIRAVDFSTPDKLLHLLFANVATRESLRAIIDISAGFKGINNLDVSRKIASYVREHPAQFSTPTPLQYVMFFNDQNILCALGIEEGSRPIVMGSTDPDEINDTLKCLPDARFSYYDQSHTVGVDLKQSQHAKAFVLVDHETQLQNFTQGCLRMRGLAYEQGIEIIVPNNMETQTLLPLIRLLSTNEEKQLQQDNFTATQAQMTNLIRADFMRRLLALPKEDIEKKHAYACQFKDYFVEQASADFFAVYGSLSNMQPANNILTTQRDRLLQDWSRIVSALPDEIMEHDHMCMQLDKIINKALPQCLDRYISPTRQEQGMEVEVQNQVQVELQKETQLERELFNPLLQEEPYKRWYGESIWGEAFSNHVKGLKRLSSWSKQCLLETPDFSGIYVSDNYSQVYQGQTQWMGAYLKPVHILLFRQDRDGAIECVIISQQDAEQLTAVVKGSSNYWYPNIWLCTTQHTLLAGRPPANITNHSAYQQLIEKVRFFNGEFSLLLSSKQPLSWLSEDTEKKLAFFEQYLLPYRETHQNEVLALRQALSQRMSALRFIAEQPLRDYTEFDWREQISDQLTDDEITDCEQLAQAFAYAKTHWLDAGFTKETCQAGLRLSLPASAYINRYVDEQLGVVARDFRLGGGSEKMASLINALLPMLLADYIPLLKTQPQQPLAFLLKKISMGVNQSDLLLLVDLLILHGMDINALDKGGCCAMTNVIEEGGPYITQCVQLMLNRHALLPSMSIDRWRRVAPAIVEKLFMQIEAFRRIDSFIKVYAHAVRDDVKKLCDLVDISLTYHHCRLILAAIPQDADRPISGMRLSLLDYMLSQQGIEPVVVDFALTILINDKQDNAAHLLALYAKYGHQFQQHHLLEMLPRGNDDELREQKEEVAQLFVLICHHDAADDDVVRMVIHDALSLGLDHHFWQNIPEKINLINLSGHEVIKQSPLVLKRIFKSIRHATEIDISNNQLGTQGSAQLADILAYLPSSRKMKLDLCDNDIDSQSLITILPSIPSSVVSIAYKDHDFRPREEVDAMIPNHSFLFNCLASVAMLAGGILLALGLYLLAPLMLGLGVGIIALSVVSMGLVNFGVFSPKPSRVVDELDEEIVLDCG